MLGYVLATLVGLILVAFCLAGWKGTRARPAGEERPKRDAQPAADEPTPDRSVTASLREMDAARKHTPPA